MANQQKMLCVVMICHDDISHIKRSIDAYKAQRTPDTTILFVDDFSSDGSGDFAKSLIGDCGEVIRTPHNLGVGGARNFGIEHLKRLPLDSRPKYIWFHDSDDYISSGAIEKIISKLHEAEDVDCLSLTIGTKIIDKTSGKECLHQGPVIASRIEDSVSGPVGVWSIVFKLSKYVAMASYQMCEHVAWHYLQFDQFDTWTKIEGESPCYIWDRTNDKAITETVSFCGDNSYTLEALAFNNILVRKGLKDRWVSDNLRNIANMYDVRHQIKKQYVKMAWAIRFRNEVANMLSGRHIH